MHEKPHLDHPTIAHVRERFGQRDIKLRATEFRGQTTLVVPREYLHEVMQFLCDDAACDYNFLADVTGVDYLNYPRVEESPQERFAVIYNLVSFRHNQRMLVQAPLDPSIDTSGIEEDPQLVLASVTDIWPGAEWREREVFDMFGIRFTNHPDLRRILTWEQFPAHPLRKDYPLTGRGERETYHVVHREDA